MASPDAAEARHPLPDFGRPPVVETVVSIQFRPIPALTSTRIGQFWERNLSKDLPAVEERPRYEIPIEQFAPAQGTIGIQLRLGGTFTPRAFFSGGNDLVQIQNDWFAYNWRKTPETPEYARYEQGRAKFEHYLNQFQDFVIRELGTGLIPVQAEVTYLNRIELTAADSEVGPLGEVLRDAGPAARDFLPRPESARYAASYVIRRDDGRPVGRLHVSADPAIELPKSQVLVLNLTARGHPLGDGIPGGLAFCDLGREWVVRGFKSLTTESMWERWDLRGDR